MVTGCGDSATRSATSTPETSTSVDDDQGGDQADEHDDHAGHQHAAHGPNGGHLVELSGGSHAEWTHDDKTSLVTVHVEDPSSVSLVRVDVTIDGEVTVYEFEKAEVDGKVCYQSVSPELLTAIKMGEVVSTQLVIIQEDGQRAGRIEHHAH